MRNINPLLMILGIFVFSSLLHAQKHLQTDDQDLTLFVGHWHLYACNADEHAQPEDLSIELDFDENAKPALLINQVFTPINKLYNPKNISGQYAAKGEHMYLSFQWTQLKNCSLEMKTVDDFNNCLGTSLNEAHIGERIKTMQTMTLNPYGSSLRVETDRLMCWYLKEA